MIIFYNKKTGKIVGNIGGRYHTSHMDMWIGDKEENDRLIIDWRPANDENGAIIEGQTVCNYSNEELALAIEENPLILNTLKVDVEKKELIPNG